VYPRPGNRAHARRQRRFPRVLIVLAVVSICIDDAFTSARWGTLVAGGCAVLLGILTVVTLNRQASRRRKQS